MEPHVAALLAGLNADGSVQDVGAATAGLDTCNMMVLTQGLPAPPDLVAAITACLKDGSPTFLPIVASLVKNLLSTAHAAPMFKTLERATVFKLLACSLAGVASIQPSQALFAKAAAAVPEPPEYTIDTIETLVDAFSLGFHHSKTAILRAGAYVAVCKQLPRIWGDNIAKAKAVRLVVQCSMCRVDHAFLHTIVRHIVPALRRCFEDADGVVVSQTCDLMLELVRVLTSPIHCVKRDALGWKPAEMEKLCYLVVHGLAGVVLGTGAWRPDTHTTTLVLETLRRMVVACPACAPVATATGLVSCVCAALVQHASAAAASTLPLQSGAGGAPPGDSGALPSPVPEAVLARLVDLCLALLCSDGPHPAIVEALLTSTAVLPAGLQTQALHGLASHLERDPGALAPHADQLLAVLTALLVGPTAASTSTSTSAAPAPTATEAVAVRLLHCLVVAVPATCGGVVRHGVLDVLQHRYHRVLGMWLHREAPSAPGGIVSNAEALARRVVDVVRAVQAHVRVDGGAWAVVDGKVQSGVLQRLQDAAARLTAAAGGGDMKATALALVAVREVLGEGPTAYEAAATGLLPALLAFLGLDTAAPGAGDLVPRLRAFSAVFTGSAPPGVDVDVAPTSSMGPLCRLLHDCLAATPEAFPLFKWPMPVTSVADLMDDIRATVCLHVDAGVDKPFDVVAERYAAIADVQDHVYSQVAPRLPSTFDPAAYHADDMLGAVAVPNDLLSNNVRVRVVQLRNGVLQFRCRNARERPVRFKLTMTLVENVVFDRPFADGSVSAVIAAGRANNNLLCFKREDPTVRYRYKFDWEFQELVGGTPAYQPPPVWDYQAPTWTPPVEPVVSASTGWFENIQEVLSEEAVSTTLLCRRVRIASGAVQLRAYNSGSRPVVVTAKLTGSNFVCDRVMVTPEGDEIPAHMPLRATTAVTLRPPVLPPGAPLPPAGGDAPPTTNDAELPHATDDAEPPPTTDDATTDDAEPPPTADDAEPPPAEPAAPPPPAAGAPAAGAPPPPAAGSHLPDALGYPPLPAQQFAGPYEVRVVIPAECANNDIVIVDARDRTAPVDVSAEWSFTVEELNDEARLLVPNPETGEMELDPRVRSHLIEFFDQHSTVQVAEGDGPFSKAMSELDFLYYMYTPFVGAASDVVAGNVAATRFRSLFQSFDTNEDGHFTLQGFLGFYREACDSRPHNVWKDLCYYGVDQQFRRVHPFVVHRDPLWPPEWARGGLKASEYLALNPVGPPAHHVAAPLAGYQAPGQMSDDELLQMAIRASLADAGATTDGPAPDAAAAPPPAAGDSDPVAAAAPAPDDGVEAAPGVVVGDAPGAAADGEPIACEMCTFLNAPMSTMCMICGSPLLAVAPPPLPPAAAAAPELVAPELVAPELVPPAVAVEPAAPVDTFAVGEVVEAKWKLGAIWYAATISEVSPDGGATYGVKYGDGDYDPAVPAHNIRRDPRVRVVEAVEVGMAVSVLDAAGSWRPGTVREVGPPEAGSTSTTARVEYRREGVEDEWVTVPSERVVSLFADSVPAAPGIVDGPGMEHLNRGDYLLALDTVRNWCKAEVMDVRFVAAGGKEVLVHYLGWKSSFDEWLPVVSTRLAELEAHKEQPPGRICDQPLPMFVSPMCGEVAVDAGVEESKAEGGVPAVEVAPAREAVAAPTPEAAEAPTPEAVAAPTPAAAVAPTPETAGEPAGDFWACPSCTFHNAAVATVCDVCATPRPFKMEAVEAPDEEEGPVDAWGWSPTQHSEHCYTSPDRRTVTFVRPQRMVATMAARATFIMRPGTGVYHWTVHAMQCHNRKMTVGLVSPFYAMNIPGADMPLVGLDNCSWGFDNQGRCWHNGAAAATVSPGFEVGDRVGMTLDTNAGTLCVFVNGRPVNDGLPIFSGVTTPELAPAVATTARTARFMVHAGGHAGVPLSALDFPNHFHYLHKPTPGATPVAAVCPVCANGVRVPDVVAHMAEEHPVELPAAPATFNGESAGLPLRSSAPGGVVRRQLSGAMSAGQVGDELNRRGAALQGGQVPPGGPVEAAALPGCTPPFVTWVPPALRDVSEDVPADVQAALGELGVPEHTRGLVPAVRQGSGGAVLTAHGRTLPHAGTVLAAVAAAGDTSHLSSCPALPLSWLEPRGDVPVAGVAPAAAGAGAEAAPKPATKLLVDALPLTAAGGDFDEAGVAAGGGDSAAMREALGDLHAASRLALAGGVEPAHLNLINHRVSVVWSGGRRTFVGIVDDYLPSRGHHLVYEDGEARWVDLTDRSFTDLGSVFPVSKAAASPPAAEQAADALAATRVRCDMPPVGAPLPFDGLVRGEEAPEAPPRDEPRAQALALAAAHTSSQHPAAGMLTACGRWVWLDAPVVATLGGVRGFAQRAAAALSPTRPLFGFGCAAAASGGGVDTAPPPPTSFEPAEALLQAYVAASDALTAVYKQLAERLPHPPAASPKADGGAGLATPPRPLLVASPSATTLESPDVVSPLGRMLSASPQTPHAADTPTAAPAASPTTGGDAAGPAFVVVMGLQRRPAAEVDAIRDSIVAELTPFAAPLVPTVADSGAVRVLVGGSSLASTLADTVERVDVPVDAATGAAYGFAVVEFGSPKAAKLAFHAFKALPCTPHLVLHPGDACLQAALPPQLFTEAGLSALCSSAPGEPRPPHVANGVEAALRLLWVAAELGLAPPGALASQFLSNRAQQQLADVVFSAVGGVPGWLYGVGMHHRHLLPLDTRAALFHKRASGVSRAVLQAHQYIEEHALSAATSRDREAALTRHEIQLEAERGRLLHTAGDLFNWWCEPFYKVCAGLASRSDFAPEDGVDSAGRRNAILNITFVGETAHGAGVTREFYTLACRDLQRRKLGLWLDDGDGEAGLGGGGDHAYADVAATVSRKYVTAGHGLFPAALDAAGAWVPPVHDRLRLFVLMGRLVAKALQDGHDVDLPLSVPFLKLVLGEAIDMEDVVTVHPDARGTVSWLCKLRDAKEAGGAALGSLAADVEAASLSFVVGEQEVVPGGAAKDVTLDNVEEYMAAVVDTVVVKPGAAPAAAFRDGLACVLDPVYLRLFSAAELAGLLSDGGAEADALWQPDATLPTLRFHASERHRFTPQSPQIQWLGQVLAELTPPQRRLFLEFTTSSPRMPVEGMAALKPARLQVNKRVPADASVSTDDMDVHCRTCTVELELPAYSSLDVLRTRLVGAIYSMADGRGGFKFNS